MRVLLLVSGEIKSWTRTRKTDSDQVFLKYHNGCFSRQKSPFCPLDRWLQTARAFSPPLRNSVTPFKSRSYDSPAGLFPF